MHNLATLYSDLKKYAEIAEVKFNSEAVREMLDVFVDLYSTAAIAVRTTTHPIGIRDVNFRYMAYRCEYPHDPYRRLIEEGILVLEGHPVEKVIPELVARYPLWWGADVAVSHGFEKIWTFFEDGVPIDTLLELPCLPDSARNYGKRIKKIAFDKVYIMAIDFWHKSVNFYSPRYPPEEQHFTRDQVAALITDAGFELPSEEELLHDTDTDQFYYTFNWDSPLVQRLCFAVVSPPEVFPIWHPLCKTWLENVPIRADQRMFIFNPTYGLNGNYLKIEADYVGPASTGFSHESVTAKAREASR